MKRALSVLLAVLLCLGVVSPALALEYGEEYQGYAVTISQTYTDVPANHWAMKSIHVCTERGWFGGYPDHTFRPEGYITREEAAKVFAMALGLEVDENPVITFTDTRDNWAKAYIEAAKVLFPNVENLQGAASFRPKQTITREETVYALVVAWRFASKVINADLSILNMFSDQQTISAAIKPYVAVAVQEQLVSGMPDGKGGQAFGGQKGLTRAEFATLLARALDHGYGPDSTEAPQIYLDRYESETVTSAATLTGSVEPMNRGVKLAVNGRSADLAADGSFSVSVELEEGVNSFTLSAANLYGVGTSVTAAILRNPAVTVGAGEWLEMLPAGVDATAYNVETRLQSRIQMKERRTSSESRIQGWTLVNSDLTWGEWSDWQAEAVEESDTRRVETQTETGVAKTQYRYWAYAGRLNQEGFNLPEIPASAYEGAPWRHFSEDWMAQYAQAGYEKTYTPWLDAPVEPVLSVERIRDGVKVDGWFNDDWSWEDARSGNTQEYLVDGQVYFGEESQDITDGTTTLYRYQDATPSNTFERWTGWSGWRDGTIEETPEIRVETRTVYRYTSR